MSAFYRMDYVGRGGSGGGGIYIGNGVVVGIDVVGGTFDGTYSNVGGRLKGTVKMTAPARGAHLATGQKVPAGATFNLNFDFPPDFDNGRPQRILGVGAQSVQVKFKKLKDLP